MKASLQSTKRMVASITVQVFDVLGFFAPATIQAKILLQHLWQKGIGWDQEIPKDLQQQWDIWLADLPAIRDTPLI